MSQPVKLSDSLVLDARLAGEVVERSIAGQVEFWARLGRSVDLLLEGHQVLALCGNALPISELLTSVDAAAGHKRVAEYLETQPYPHFRPHPERAGFLERIEEDGTRTVGRFVQRTWVTAEASAEKKRARGTEPAKKSATGD